jgi:hypothetical protein
MSRLDQLAAELCALTDIERAELVARVLPECGVGALSRIAAAWWSALDVVAKVSPPLAGDLARGMYCHLAAFRPETPHPLDSGFAPTESVPTRPPRAGGG